MTLGRAELTGLARLAEGRFGLPGRLGAEGEMTSRVGGTGNEFRDVAPYQPGDDLRAVDWRASARRGQPLVRRYAQRAAGNWLIHLDCSASMRFGARWTCAADLAGALAGLLLHQGHRVGLVTFDSAARSFVPPRPGTRHLATILDRLSAPPLAQPGTGSLRSAFTHADRGGGLVVISDLLWGAELSPALRTIAAACRRGHVLRLGVADDTRLPSGAQLLCDAESGLRQGVADAPAALEQAAQNRLADLEAEARQVCRRKGLAYSSCDSAEGWRRVLTRHLSALPARGG
ncbi:DUF58 domain-containing protein [Marinovum sp. KMM 9879]